MLKILQIGNGNMGSVVSQAALKNGYNITILRKNSQSVILPTEKFNVIILATKPQNFHEIQSQVKSFSSEGTFVISIMAGLSSTYLQKALNTPNIIRIMPSIGLKTNCGVSLLLKCQALLGSVEQLINQTFASSGNILLNVKSDEEINQLTPFTGSGCALFLRLASIFAQNFAQISGLESNACQEITKSIIKQAVNMAQENTFDESIAQIASKGGITQAMLESFNSQISQITLNAINAGQERAGTLAKTIEGNH